MECKSYVYMLPLVCYWTIMRLDSRKWQLKCICMKIAWIVGLPNIMYNIPRDWNCNITVIQAKNMLLLEKSFLVQSTWFSWDYQNSEHVGVHGENSKGTLCSSFCWKNLTTTKCGRQISFFGWLEGVIENVFISKSFARYFAKLLHIQRKNYRFQWNQDRIIRARNYLAH